MQLTNNRVVGTKKLTLKEAILIAATTALLATIFFHFLLQ